MSAREPCRKGETRLKTNTKYFGEIEYDEEEVLTFPKGLFGFEGEQRFLLLPFSGNGTLFSLQSLTTSDLAFVVMDPFSLSGDYAPDVPDGELASIGMEEGDPLSVYTLCVVRNPVAESTVNLKCPVVINNAKQLAVQVILDEGGYGMRHKLAEFEKQEEKPC